MWFQTKKLAIFVLGYRGLDMKLFILSLAKSNAVEIQQLFESAPSKSNNEKVALDHSNDILRYSGFDDPFVL